jgi:hypothetical protein
MIIASLDYSRVEIAADAVRVGPPKGKKIAIIIKIIK